MQTNTKQYEQAKGSLIMARALNSNEIKKDKGIKCRHAFRCEHDGNGQQATTGIECSIEIFRQRYFSPFIHLLSHWIILNFGIAVYRVFAMLQEY